MNTWKTTVLLLPFLIISHLADAQGGKYEIGVSAGTFIYRGDLTPSPFGSYRTPSINVNLFVNRVLSPEFALRGQLAWGRLRGDDAAYEKPEWRQHRNFNFSATVTEVSALLVWNKWGTERRLAPYLFAGLGLGFTRISRDHSGLDTVYFAQDHLPNRLGQDMAVTPPRALPVLPLGAGLRYQVSPAISVTLETSFRLTRSDYIDGFSLAANPKMKDHYQSHTVGLIYNFPAKSSGVGCPVW